MVASHWRLIADLLDAATEGEDVGAAIASVASRLLGADGVSLAFVANGQPTSLAGSTEVAVELCRLQFALGEGPTLVALEVGEPSFSPDVTEPEGNGAAPLLVAAAEELGVGAIFAFPLRVGGGLVGVMTAHRASAGPLTVEQYTDGLIVSTLATIGMLQIEAGAAAGRVEVRYDPMSELHAILQVAGGMVSELLSVSIVEALVRIRARAFAEDRSVDAVARDIVARRLVLER